MTVRDVLNSPDFGPAVLRAVQSPSLRGYMVGRSIPQRALDVPVGSFLPRVAEDKDEFFLIVDSANNIVHHYRYRAAVAAWEFVGDKRPQVVTALPTTGLYEGLQVVYDTGTSGVRWTFVYDTSDGTTYPWLFVGGPPLFAEVTTVESRTNTAYGALATAGPSVTVPLAGDYDVWIGATVTPGSPGVIAKMSYDIGGTGAADADAVRVHTGATQVSANRTRRKTGLSASTALVSKYAETVATGSSWQGRFMSVNPVRVV